MYEMSRQNNSEVLAGVIHAFYVDIFTRIIHSLKDISVPIKIYVTTTSEHKSEINQILVSSAVDFFLLPVDNRGRFLELRRGAGGPPFPECFLGCLGQSLIPGGGEPPLSALPAYF